MAPAPPSDASPRQSAAALQSSAAARPVVLLGATGHTGGFVLAELHRRGRQVILAGRNEAALAVRARSHPGSAIRLAAADDPAALDGALSGAAAVIHCAGPFADTAAPVIEAALRAGAHYLDVTAEQAVALATFEGYAAGARQAGVMVLPAMGFFGGLGDLLATAALGDWPDADEIRLAFALDSWQPTRGTRATVLRNAGRHLTFAAGRLQPADPAAPRIRWAFPQPVGIQEVVPLAVADQVTISRHLRTPRIQAYMNEAPLRELRDPCTPSPLPTDDSGRSAQTFVVDLVARRGGAERRITAAGRDIYAVTAPLVAEALDRILDGRAAGAGVFAAGEIFDARAFLAALSPDPLSVVIHAPALPRSDLSGPAWLPLDLR